MEEKVDRTRSFYQITHSLCHFSEKTVLQITRTKTPGGVRSNFNREVIKAKLVRDPIVLDFYISHYLTLCLFSEAVLSFNFLK